MDRRDGAAQMTEYAAADFPILADPDGIATRDYGVYNLLRDGVAAPAVFILDSDGVIEFSYIGSDAGDRPPADELLRLLGELRQPRG
jgi:peroxiredoxin